MKFIIWLTFTIGCFTLIRALNLNEVAYRLSLGPLEFFLKLKSEDVSRCYEKSDDDYINSVVEFSQKVSQKKQNVNKIFDTNTFDKNRMMYALNEMEFISESLKKFFGELKGSIFNGELDGGKVIWGQRRDMEKHLKQYETHKNALKGRKENLYLFFGSSADENFDKMLEQSDKLTRRVLECCANKNVSYAEYDA